MSETIWKFNLETTDYQTVKMPKGAEILDIQTQGGQPCLWALVDPSKENEDRNFEVFGTGHKVSGDMGISRKYIATYQLESGALIFHVFERLN